MLSINIDIVQTIYTSKKETLRWAFDFCPKIVIHYIAKAFECNLSVTDRGIGIFFSKAIFLSYFITEAQ
jgi:hypothetical protein